jgi:hypothetical protein
MRKSTGPLHEYACHEGTYGLMNVPGATRVVDRADAQAKQ